MRKTLKLLLILSAIIMTACHNNEQEIDISWTQEAARIVYGGLKTDFEHKTISLDFSADTQIELSSSSSENWIKPTVTFSEGKGQLSIEILENNTLSSREGKIIFIAQGKVVTIKVFQDGNPKVSVDKNIYYHGANSGNVEIHVKAKGELSAGIYPTECKWARVIKTIPSGDNEYAITVAIDKNEGLGRVASVDFKVDGKTANQDCGPCLVQEPAPFTNTTTIICEKPGCLQVLMGNDLTNLRRIRSLKLIGNINGLDFLLLRKLFLDITESFSQYPIDIDISKCNIVTGNQNPYEYFGWQPSKIFEDVFMYDEIPSGVFSNASNLKNIILPKNLKIVGYSAFAGCKSLKTIDIPADVEEINSKAFYGCMSLQEINLTSNECLTSIGNQAFTTKSTLNELTIPATVVNVGVEAFLGCSVSKLHLKWSEPLEVRIVPKTDGCTLYVPKGTKELYRNTRNWSKFLNVIEE
ncbi:Putative binding domain-containing protein, N-terminal [Prevotellaceae bacterium KH2P17]|nr:Putative binding domain-containing protein, N-terminal [Prevotellaceae bacterium KH2P17]